jgi:hypothetical protein
MFKLFRIFAIVLIASLLASGSTLAGPGDKTDGDPEIPQVTNPLGGKNVTGVPTMAGTARRSPTNPALSEARDRWLATLKVYLRLVRNLTF